MGSLLGTALARDDAPESAPPQPVLDRETLDAADEVRGEPLDRAGELDLLEARQEVTIGHLELEPRHVGAGAEVLADAEGEVTVRVAVDAEAVRVLEDLLVAVRRGVEERDDVAAADALPAQLDVGRGGAGEVDDRARPAQDLLDPALEQVRPRLEAAPLLGMLD